MGSEQPCLWLSFFSHLIKKNYFAILKREMRKRLEYLLTCFVSLMVIIFFLNDEDKLAITILNLMDLNSNS